MISASSKYLYTRVAKRTASSLNPSAGPNGSPGAGKRKRIHYAIASARWLRHSARRRAFAFAVDMISKFPSGVNIPGRRRRCAASVPPTGRYGVSDVDCCALLPRNGVAECKLVVGFALISPAPLFIIRVGGSSLHAFRCLTIRSGGGMPDPRSTFTRYHVVGFTSFVLTMRFLDPSPGSFGADIGCLDSYFTCLTCRYPAKSGSICDRCIPV